MERDYQFYVFDFIDDGFSTVAEMALEYPSRIAHWMSKDPAALASFFDFAGSFDLQAIDVNLERVLRLYDMQSGHPIDASHPDWDEALEYCFKQLRPEAFHTFMDLFDGIDQRLGQSASIEQWSLICQFLIRGAQTTDSGAHWQSACALWVAMFDTFYLGMQQGESELVSIRSAPIRSPTVSLRTRCRILERRANREPSR